MATKKQVEKPIEETPKKEKLTTSKKLLVVAWGLLIILIALDIFGVDVETSLEMVGGLVTAIISSVYMHKARCENKLKIAKSMIFDLADTYGIENITPIVEKVLDD